MNNIRWEYTKKEKQKAEEWLKSFKKLEDIRISKTLKLKPRLIYVQ